MNIVVTSEFPLPCITKNIFLNNIIPFLDPKNIVRLFPVHPAWNEVLSDNTLWEKLYHRISAKNISHHLEFLTLSLDILRTAHNIRMNGLHPVKTLKGHTDEVNCIDSTSNLFISASYDKILIRKLNEKNTLDFSDEKFEFVGHEDRNGVGGLEIVGNNFAIMGFKHKLILIRNFFGSLMKSLDNQVDVSCIKATHDGFLISGAWDGTIKIWNQEGSLLRTLTDKNTTGHKRDICCIGAMDNKIFTGASDHTLRIWNKNTGELLHTLNVTNTIADIQVTSELIVAGCFDGKIYVWKQSNYTLQCIFEAQKRIKAIQIIDNLIISCRRDGKIDIWDINRKFHPPKHSFKLDTEVACVKYIEDHLIIGCANGEILIYASNKVL